MNIIGLVMRGTLACGILLAIAISPSHAAVQLGMHMDFILSNGTTVRVFPAAGSSATAGARPVWEPLPSTRNSANANPCQALQSAYGSRQQGASRYVTNQAIARMRPVGGSGRPAWLRQTPALRRVIGNAALRTMPKPSAWYYLPTEPRLSFKDGKPEAMFMNFITDETTDQGGAEGGLFHLLVTYGLSKEEEAELRSELSKAVPGAVLKGQVDLLPSGNNQNFIVTSGTLSDKGFAPEGVLTSGFAPTQPGGKVAMAARLSATGAQLLAKTFENKNGTADLSVTFIYDYIAKTRAFTAELTIQLDQIREVTECIERSRRTNKESFFEFKVFFPGRGERVTGVTQEQIEGMYDLLLTSGMIEIKIDQNLPDVDVSMIENALMANAMESFLSMQRQFQSSPVDMPEINNDSEDDEDDTPNTDNYRVYEISTKRSRMQARLRYRVTKEMAVYRSHIITGNMGAELRRYRDTVFSNVLLNDPFFKRGEIIVSVDPAAFPLFDAKIINNASVSIEVPISGTTPFTEQTAFFARDVVGAVDAFRKFTFATNGKGSPNPDCILRYRASWSLRGGGQWPKNPKMRCSNQLAITLSPPVFARTIDVEADLGEMEAVGIRAADVILRHKRYGRDNLETVKFRVAQGVGYQSAMLFIDRNESGQQPPVEYSIVFTHKTAGQLPQTPWQRLEGDFVIANIGGLPASYLQKIVGSVGGVEQFME